MLSVLCVVLFVICLYVLLFEFVIVGGNARIAVYVFCLFCVCVLVGVVRFVRCLLLLVGVCLIVAYVIAGVL